jgi:hypothetical protein
MTYSRYQFRLASLFAITLAVCLLLWAWRFGPQRVVLIMAIVPAAVFVPIWLCLLGRKLLANMHDDRA